HRALRCDGVAGQTGCRVRAVPDLPQRTLALRTAPEGRRGRLPAYVCQPHAGPEDAAVSTSPLDTTEGGRGRTIAPADRAATEEGDADSRRTRAWIRRAGLRRAVRTGFQPEPWKRGLVTAGLALLLGLAMLLHAKIPNRIGNVGSLVETFLP